MAQRQQPPSKETMQTQIIKDDKKQDIRGKYKIEVMFDKNRTSLGPNLLGIQLWESGKKFNGDGDEMMYWCMDLKTNQGCKSPIPADSIKGPFAMCPSCKQGIMIEHATNMRVLRVSTRVLADELASLFRKVGQNADIYVKYNRDDPHYIAMEKSSGAAVAKKLRGMHIYPLKNILKETMNGASLEDRFFAFLTA